MAILRRRNSLNRVRFDFQAWIPRPNSGNFAKDVVFLMCVAFFQLTIVPYFFGTRGYLDFMTPWLVITFIRQKPLQAAILSCVGAVTLETRLAVPGGLYLCAYWILASVLIQIRPALSWRYKTPWLVSYTVATIWMILFELFVISFLQSASLFSAGFIVQQIVRLFVAVSFGMYLSREWMTIDAEEPVPQ